MKTLRGILLQPGALKAAGPLWISRVIPLHNEEETLGELYRRTQTTMDTVGTKGRFSRAFTSFSKHGPLTLLAAA